MLDKKIDYFSNLNKKYKQKEPRNHKYITHFST